MILEFLLTAFLALVMGLFGWLPNIPPIPTAISDMGEQVIDIVAGVASILAMLLSPALLLAGTSAIIVMIFFHQIYFVVLWVLKKIPFINLK